MMNNSPIWSKVTSLGPHNHSHLCSCDWIATRLDISNRLKRSYIKTTENLIIRVEDLLGRKILQVLPRIVQNILSSWVIIFNAPIFTKCWLKDLAFCWNFIPDSWLSVRIPISLIIELNIRTLPKRLL